MPRRLALALCICTLLFAVSSRTSTAAEPVAWAPADLAAHETFYVEFARQLQATNDAIAIAQRNVAYWQARVDGYRPFRSLGRYAATYTADLAAQLRLAAAQQELARLVRAKDDLWRGRQLRAAGF